MPTRQGSIRLFRFSGIDVFLHWSWFLLAYYEINARKGNYSSIRWNVAEYLALFLIVTIHEFGHALACRQVGGQADRIVLWPFGGVAYVNPPQRPGATLWSIAAGPLVNVVLAPIIIVIHQFCLHAGWYAAVHDLRPFLHAVFVIDVVLFVFNILPIYPLDGGQILRSLLWFVMGRARSLLVATVLGFRNRRIHRARDLYARALARRHCHLLAHELLGRTPARARPAALRKVAAAIGIRLPLMPIEPANRRLLEVRKLWPSLR